MGTFLRKSALITVSALLTACTNLGVVSITPVPDADESQRVRVDMKKPNRRQRLVESKHTYLSAIDDPVRELPKSITENFHVVFPHASLQTPSGARSKPLRHFGPFNAGSDLSQIQVLITGLLFHGWYHNDFFSNHPDDAVFAKYYPGEDTPDRSISETPTVQHDPGTFPGISGNQPESFNDILLSLASIHYTSAYGGSIRLLFRSSENTEFEVRRNNTLWDVRRLEMSVYVQPDRNKLDPIRPGVFGNAAFWRKRIHAEFRPERVTQYTISDAGTDNQKMAMVSSPAIDDLKAALAILGDRVEQNIAIHAARFAHGFLQSQFQTLIDGKVVDSLEISDDFVDMVTRDPQPYLWVRARIGTIWSQADYVLGSCTIFNCEGEYVVVIHSSRVRSDGGLEPGRTLTEALDQNGASSWQYYVGHEASLCADFPAVSFDILVSEIDPNSRLNFHPIGNWWQFDCDSISAAIEAGRQTKLVQQLDQYAVYSGLLHSGDDIGSLFMQYSLMLTWR